MSCVVLAAALNLAMRSDKLVPTLGVVLEHAGRRSASAQVHCTHVVVHGRNANMADAGDDCKAGGLKGWLVGGPYDPPVNASNEVTLGFATVCRGTWLMRQACGLQSMDKQLIAVYVYRQVREILNFKNTK